MKKRVLSFLLALVMVLSMLPVLDLTAVLVSAEEAQATEVSLTLKPVKQHADESYQVAVDVQLSSTTEFTLGSLQFSVKPAVEGMTAAMDISATGITDLTADQDADENAKTNVIFVETDGENLVTVGTTPVTVGTLTLTGTAPYSYSDELLTIDTEIVGVSQSDTTYPLNVATSYGYTKCGHGTAQWTPLSNDMTISTTTITEGYYYLTEDVTIDSNFGDAFKNRDVVICLNGHNFNGLGTGRMLRLSGGVNLTICDCTAHIDGEGNYIAGTVSNPVSSTGVGYNGIKGSVIGLYDGTNTFTLEDGILDGKGQTANAADGGAIGINSDSVVTINGGVIQDFAAVRGGAIGIESGRFVMNGGIIRNNTATSYGGAIYVAAGNTQTNVITINGGTISNNTADDGIADESSEEDGGAIFIAKSTKSITPKLKITEAVISGNTATGSGGAICANGEITITDTEVTSNIASKNGGVVYSANGSLEITGGTFSGNKGVLGSVVYGIASASLTVSDATISNNTATGNAALWKAGSTMDITGVTMTGNKNQGAGASALYGEGGAVVTVTDSSITGNQSTGDKGTGAIYIAGQTTPLTLSGTVVVDNNTIQSGAEQNIYFVAEYGGDKENVLYVNELAEGSSVTITTNPSYAVRTEAKKLLQIAAGGSQSTWNGNWVTYTQNAESEIVWSDTDGCFVFDTHAHEEFAGATWQKWGDSADELTKLPTTVPDGSEVGYYYLVEDIDLTVMNQITTQKNVVLCLNNHTVTAANGKRIYRLNGGANLTICDCTAHTDEDGVYHAGKLIPTTTQGGAIGLYPDTSSETTANTGNTVLTWTDGIIDGEGVTCTGNGGAIHVSDGKASGTTTLSGYSIGEVYITGGEFRNCTAANGGVISLYIKSVLDIANCTFTGNSGNNGSVIYAQSGATVNLTNTTITGNGHTGTGGGSAVYIAGQSTPLTVSGKVIIDDNYNKSGLEMNVFFNNATCNPATNKNLLFVNGLADGSRISITTTTSNSAPNRTDANAVVKKSTATGAVQTTWDPSWVKYENTGKNVVLDTLDAAAGTITFTFGHKHEGDAENTTWNAVTDALPSAAGNYYLTKDITLTGPRSIDVSETVTNIVLCLNGYTITGPSGGRIFRLQGGVKLTICDCTAHTTGTGEDAVYHAGKMIPGTAKGGAIGVFPDRTETANPVFTLKDGIIDGTGVINAGEGGAIQIGQNTAGTVSVGEVHIDGGEIRNCTATTGGAVAIYSAGKFYMTDGKITGNTATNTTTGGGAIRVGDSTTAEITGGVISGNTSNVLGGAISVGASANVTITGAVLSGNTTSTTGGAISSDNSTITVSNTTISGNKATTNGGAIWVNGGSVTINQNSEISGNTAAQGGAIFSNGANAATTIDIDNAVIQNNTTSGNGSAIRTCYDGTTAKYVTDLTIDNTQIINNTTTGNSIGAIYLQNGVQTFTNVTMTGNKGGTVSVMHIESGADPVLNNCTVQNNNSTTGGAIKLFNKNSTLTVKGNTIIADNQSNGREQNVYLQRGSNNNADTGFIALSELGANAKVGVTAQYKDGTVGSVKVAAKDVTYADGKLFSDNELRSLEISGDDINLTRPQIANLIAADKTVTPYYELNKATAALTETDILQLVHDVPEDDVTNHLRNLTGTVTLDLNGYDVLSQITGTAATLQLIDSQTNDYSVKDAEGNLTGYGKIASIAEDVIVSQWHKVGGKYYLVLDLEDGISAHRVYSSVTAKTLRTNSTGIGFQARFATNEVAREKITGFGMDLVVKDGETVKGTVPLDVMALSDRKLDSAGTPLVFAIKDIIKNTDAVIEADSANEATLIAENNTYANYTIAGTPFIKLSESESYNGTSSTVTFKDMVQTADRNFTNYNETQQTAFRTMCGKFSQTMSDWELSVFAQ